MKRYVCSVCGFVYEEARGLPDAGIPPGTAWADLPGGWVCPVCRAGKSAFREEGAAPAEPPAPAAAHPPVERELSAMEMSVLCSNLARGCEKQYLEAESRQFARLAEQFRAQVPPPADPAFSGLLALVQKDLETLYPYADQTAADAGDRGALRALTWSRKVTAMLASLLERWEREGERMLEHTGVYVCTVCGFVFAGDEPPSQCPVCKVPAWKFERMEGRAG